jgi:ubiquitin-activating enzyme E1-like protein
MAASPPHVYFSQYWKDAPSGNIEQKTHDDNAGVFAPVAIQDTTYTYIAYPTASGVACVKRTIATGASLHAGWITQANTTCAAFANDGSDDVLYIGHGDHDGDNDGNLGKADWDDLFTLLTPTAITKANPGSVTCAGHGLATGDKVYFESVGGMTELDNNEYTITVVDMNTFTLGADTSAYTTFTSGGSISYERLSGALAYDDDWGENNGAFKDANPYDVFCIAAAERLGVWHVCFMYDDSIMENPTQGGLLGQFTPSTSTEFYSTLFEGTSALAMDTKGLLSGIHGTNLWRYNYPALADGFVANVGAFGNLDDPCDDSTVATCLNTAENLADTSQSLSENGTCFEWSVTAGDDDCYSLIQYGWIDGDFDFVVTGGGGDNGTGGVANDGITNTEDTMQRILRIATGDPRTADDRVFVTFDCYWDGSQAALRAQSDIYDGGASQDPQIDAIAAPAPDPTTMSGYKLRIKRDGSTVTTYYDDGGGWTTLSTYASFPETPVLIALEVYAKSVSGETCNWDIYDIENPGLSGTPEEVYSDFDELAEFTCVAANYILANTATLTGVGIDSGGLCLLDGTDIDDDREFYTASGSGGDHEILTSDNVMSISFDTEAEIDAGDMWIGYDAAGIDKVDISQTSPIAKNFTTTVGKLIDNQAHHVAQVEPAACAYATGSGATTTGFGYVSGNTDPPADVDVDAHGVDLDDALIGWDAPTDTDRDFSRFYVRWNGGSWYHMQSDESFSATGADFKEFDTVTPATDNSHLAVHAKSLVDKKYEFKITQVDVSGNESAGTVAEPVYIDEPVITASLASATPTGDRGILINVGGNSGTDSGSATSAGCIYQVEVEQGGPTWSGSQDIHRVSTKAPSFSIPFYLTGPTGWKTVNVRAKNESGKISNSESVSVYYDSGTAVATTPTLEDRIKLCHRFVSDTATLSNNNGDGYTEKDSDYPLENIQDQDVSLPWKLNDWTVTTDLAGGPYRTCMVIFDMGQAATIDAFHVKNHNLRLISSLADQYFKVKLLAHATNLPVILGGDSKFKNWWDNASYQVDLTNLVSEHSITHRPEESYRYWALVIIYKATGAFVDKPTIGRVVMAQDSDIWSPVSPANFEPGFRFKIVDESDRVETEAQTFPGAPERELVETYSIDFRNLSSADFLELRKIYRLRQRTNDLFVMFDPSEFSTGTDTPTRPEPCYRFNGHLCNFDQDMEFSSQETHGGPESFPIRTREIVGIID